VERQLDPSGNEVNPQELHQAIQTAAEDVRRDALERVRDARKGDDATDETKRRAVPVLRALIDADKASVEHRSHSELGYILLDLGQLEESVEELTKAIDIRDRRGKSGWKYYEYRRAIARIRIAKTTGSSTPEAKRQILADLENALSDSKLKDEIKQKQEIKDWLGKNQVSLSEPAGSESVVS
jgi:tetratricopeptide (TPR) repeat protein